MKPLSLPLLLFFLATLGVEQAAAQQVWRCGADGRVFSDRPCPQGEVLQFRPAPSGAERAAARELAIRDQALADQLKEERIERARMAQGNGLVAIGPLQADIDAKRAARVLEQKRQAQRKMLRSDAVNRPYERQLQRQPQRQRPRQEQPDPPQPPVVHRLGQYP